jgi:AP-3 complex subunit mu
MMQSIFILSPTGEVLIERHFRGVTSRSVCDYFWERASEGMNHHGGLSTASTVLSFDLWSGETVPPIMEVPEETHGTLYLFSILRDGLSYLAACPAEVSPLLVIEFLHRIADIFVDYFGSPADESAIKENFSTVYQLLEEMVDYGWPLTTEPNALKAMIRPPTLVGKIQSVVTGGSNAIVSDALPSGTVSNMPWRAAGVSYSNNEIYIDIVEEIDALVDTTGNVISSDVSGSIQAQSHLSGVPDLLLTFQDPSVIDDCSFHPCVRYGRFEADSVVSFVPPDGNFELMRYRVRNAAAQMVHPPISCNPTWNFTASENDSTMNGRVSIFLSVRSVSSLILSASRRGPLVVEDVAVTIPFPKLVRTTNLEVNMGNVIYDEATKVARWTIGKLDATKRPQLTGTMVLEGKKKPQENQNLTLNWKIPLASVSGLNVSGLSLTGERYSVYKGVRNITRSGRFQVRCN